MMLQQSFELIDAPGTNAKGARGGAHWLFALPVLPVGVIWVGPTTGFESDVEALRVLVGPVRRATAADAAADPGPGEDLVVVTDPSVRAGQLGRPGRQVLEVTAAGKAGDRAWRLLRHDGVVRGIVPAADRVSAGILREHLQGERAARVSIRHHAGRLLVRRGREGTAVVNPPGGSGPPAYLVELARRHGCNLSQHRWALWCRGDYLTQKLIMLLRAPGSREADVVVKIARHPVANDRLANEAAVLDELASALGPEAERLPRVLFRGTHGRSFVCGESTVPGRPFRAEVERLSRDEAVAVLGDGARWLTTMATRTARPVTGAEVADAAGRLVDRFHELHQPDGRHVIALRHQVEVLAAIDRLPAVALHGDPGVWNALVDPSGRLSLIDWESGERWGMPLWDVLYLLRSGVMTLDRSRFGRSRHDVLRRAFVDGSTFTPLLAGAVADQVAALGLPPEAVEPLVHLCWVHRAVKQASRSTNGRPAGSSYAQLVRWGLDGRQATGFRQLVGG
jgi:hypothetical protein